MVNEAATAPGDVLDQLQPLSFSLSEEHRAAHARNTVKNVLDSYTGRFDVLVETIQNSMDALEKRWSSVEIFDGERPRLDVTLDASTETVSVWDNGAGIPPGGLVTALVPHMSPKAFDPVPTRGHKGVGTTFLAYGHPSFEIRTKIAGGEEVAYRLDGGLAWVRTTTTDAPPSFHRLVGSEALSDAASGTVVTVGVGEETRFGRLKTAQYNKLETWSLVLRSFTAVGHVSIGTPLQKLPLWLKELQVTVHLKGVAAAGHATVPVGFFLPHLGHDSAVALPSLASASAKAANARYELLFGEYDNNALETLLGPQLEELASSQLPEHQAVLNAFRTYETGVYASWAYKNTWYEDLYRERIGEDAKRFQYNNVRSGLLVTSVGMPIGEVTDHPYVTMKPEYKRRLFVVVSFNEKYSPDLGRKTIPSADRQLLQWLETQLQNVFLKHVNRLIRSNDESTHESGSFDEAREQLSAQTMKLREQYQARSALGVELAIDRAPRYESELVAVFAGLLTSQLLVGYRVIAIPGSSSRFDALVDFSTTEFATNASEHVPLGIAASRASNGKFERTGKWLEFKLRLEELVDNFTADDGDASKKYFELCDLAVVWSVPSVDAVGEYDLVEFDSSNWNERNYFGSTHRLESAGSNHRIEVIAIQNLLPLLATAE